MELEPKSSTIKYFGTFLCVMDIPSNKCAEILKCHRRAWDLSANFVPFSQTEAWADFESTPERR